MSELKPCPFCGGEAELVESDYGMYMTGYAVYCKYCCTKVGVTGRLGESYEWTPIYDTEAEAIAAWNSRAERTCEPLGTIRYDYEGGYAGFEYETELSCGHNWRDSYGDYPNYCPNCGARVVE